MVKIPFRSLSKKSGEVDSDFHISPHLPPFYATIPSYREAVEV